MSEPAIIDRVALGFTDLTGAKTGCTTKGSNKFWIGHVEQAPNGTFNFVCRWGSVGTPGKTTGSKYGLSEKAARALLQKKARSKERKGYTRLETRDETEEKAKAKAAGVKVEATAKLAPVGDVPKRTFHPNVVDLLNIIYNANSKAVRAGLSSAAGATADNPVGNLSDGQLDKGGAILDEIAGLLEKEFGPQVEENKEKVLPVDRVVDLTSRYLSNVPRKIPSHHRGRANLHKLVVSSWARLGQQREFLRLLRDAHLSRDAFKKASRLASADKAGAWYDGLSCAIEHVEQGTEDWDFVHRVFTTKQSRRNANWFRSNKSILDLVRVWKFTRDGTRQSYEQYAEKVVGKTGAAGNCWGWHGTRTENLLGIGKGGLLMPENLPPGIHISGKAFGAGIYHAPAWNATNTDKVGGHATDGTNGALKSMNYTSARGAYYSRSNTANTAYMFLQRLALGVPEVKTKASWNQKRPSGWPKKDWIYACAGGCSTLSHDEVVTFDENAQMFEYMIEVKVKGR